MPACRRAVSTLNNDRQTLYGEFNKLSEHIAKGERDDHSKEQLVTLGMSVDIGGARVDLWYLWVVSIFKLQTINIYCIHGDVNSHSCWWFVNMKRFNLITSTCPPGGPWSLRSLWSYQPSRALVALYFYNINQNSMFMKKSTERSIFATISHLQFDNVETHSRITSLAGAQRLHRPKPRSGDGLKSGHQNQCRSSAALIQWPY